MGDKSPKSNQKSKNQKQAKSDDVQQKKQQVIDSKRVLNKLGSDKKK